MRSTLTIRTRLQLGFAALILICMVVSGINIIQMRQLAMITTTLYHHSLAVGKAIRDANLALYKIRVAMKDVPSAENAAAVEKLTTAIAAYEDEANQQFALVKERFLGEQDDVDAALSLFRAWKPIRDEIIFMKRAGQEEHVVSAINEGRGNQQFAEIERAMRAVTDFSAQKALSFLRNAEQQARQAYGAAAAMLIAATGLAAGIAVALTRSIIQPLRIAINVAEHVSRGQVTVKIPPAGRDEIGQLLQAMHVMTMYLQEIASIAKQVADEDLQVQITPKSDEDVLNHTFRRMVTNLQTMVTTIETSITAAEAQNWLKEGLNQLALQLAGETDLTVVAGKAIRALAEYVQAGCGVLYVYQREQGSLVRRGAYALTAEDRLTQEFQLDEGVVGQVARERAPILLQQIPADAPWIETGTHSDRPVNTYTVPLIYDGELYGVFELATSELFSKNQQEFLDGANRVVATALFSAQQREQVQDLLQRSQQIVQETEQARAEAEQRAREAQSANAQLEEQQTLLRQQNERLQQLTVELEEQQQQIEQQREELRQQQAQFAKMKAQTA